MGKWFDYSEILRKKNLPTLTYRNGRITISKSKHLKRPEIYKESRKDLPLFYIEDGKPVIERSILDTPYCGKCLRNHYDPKKPRDHFVCTIDDLWNCLPDVERDSFGKNCNHTAPLTLPNYSRTVSETTARWRERPGRLSGFFKERARRYNIDLRRASWGKNVVNRGLLPYVRKLNLKKE